MVKISRLVVEGMNLSCICEDFQAAGSNSDAIYVEERTKPHQSKEKKQKERHAFLFLPYILESQSGVS